MKYLIIEVQEVSQNKKAEYSNQWVIEKLHPTDKFIEIGSDPKQLCKNLKDLGFIETSDMRKVSVSSMESDLIEIRGKKNLKPLLRLESARWI